MRDLSFLIDRNEQLWRRHNGYDLFTNTVANGHPQHMHLMTDADIAFWHNRLDEWEALGEAEKCQYDMLAILEQA